MSNAYKSLIWKEYRETCPVWIMVFALGVITLLALPTLIGSDHSGQSMALTVLSSMMGVYVLAVSAIAFVREVDEGRYALLRRFPITSGMIARAKVGWILVSSLGLGAAFGLIWLICLSLGYDALTNETSGRFGLAVLTCAEFFAWGLFWSVRTKRQLTALFMTPACAVLAPMPFLTLILPILKRCEMVNTVYTPWDIYSGPAGVLVRLVILAALMVPVVRGLRSWFEIQARLDERQANRATCKARRAVSIQRRISGSFRALVVQGFRQQAHLLMICGGVFYAALAVLIHRFPSIRDVGRMEPTEFGIYLAAALALITSIVLTGGVFTSDFAQKEDAPIQRFAPKPGQFWFSRVVGILGVWGIAALGAAIYYGVALVRSHDDFTFLWRLSANDYGRSAEAFSIYFVLFLLTAIPALGLWTSAFFHSRMISMFTQFALIILFFFCFSAAFGNGHAYGARDFSAHPLWSVFPLLIPFVLGSYFLVRAKLSGGVAPKTLWRQIGLVTLPPILLLLAVVPMVRVFSIAILPKNSSPEEWVNRSLGDLLRGELEYLAAWWRFREYEHRYDAFPHAAQFTDEARRLSGNTYHQFKNTSEDAITLWGRYTLGGQRPLTSGMALESQIYSFAHEQAGSWTADELRSMLELVQAIPRTRLNPAQSAADLYYVLLVHNLASKPGVFSGANRYCFYGYYASRFWWENLRYRRQLWNAAVMSCALETEELSAIEDGARQTCVRRSGPAPQRSAEFFDKLDALKRKNLLPSDKYRYEANGWTIWNNDAPNAFTVDQQRLFCLAELATLLYYREKGAWPQTLDAAVAAGYLDEVPTLRWAGVTEELRLKIGEELAEPILCTVEERLPNGTESVKIEKLCRYVRPLWIEKQAGPTPITTHKKVNLRNSPTWKPMSRFGRGATMSDCSKTTGFGTRRRSARIAATRPWPKRRLFFSNRAATRRISPKPTIAPSPQPAPDTPPSQNRPPQASGPTHNTGSTRSKSVKRNNRKACDRKPEAPACRWTLLALPRSCVRLRSRWSLAGQKLKIWLGTPAPLEAMVYSRRVRTRSVRHPGYWTYY